MTTSALFERHRAAGLTLGPAPEAPALSLPTSFGDPAAERSAALAGAALFDATASDCVLASGADAADLLQRMLAGEVRGLEPGRAAPNLLLTAKGRVRFALQLERDADALRLWTAPGRGAALAAALDAFVFTEDVALEDASASTAPLELVGPSAGAVVAAVAGADAAALAEGAWSTAAFGGKHLRVARVRVLGRPGWRLDAGPEQAATLWAALVEAGASAAGLAAREALRVEHGVALAGAELPADETDAPYPQEAGLDDAYSLTKGCYVGQEVVAKLDTYGGLKRALRRFRVASDAPPPPGTALVAADGTEAGTVTSTCDGSAGFGPALLAFVKLRLADAGPFTAGAGGPALAPLDESAQPRSFEAGA